MNFPKNFVRFFTFLTVGNIIIASIVYNIQQKLFHHLYFYNKFLNYLAKIVAKENSGVILSFVQLQLCLTAG